MREFKIDFFYNLYKDKSISSCAIFRKYMAKKYLIKDVSFVTELYQRINKYQVKKYGQNLLLNCHLVGECKSYKQKKVISGV